MKRIFNALVLMSSVTALFWVTSAPQLLRACSNGVEFAYHPQDAVGHAAGIAARTAACTWLLKDAR